jgi:hypothetical protein
MIKVLQATCEGGVVTVEGQEITPDLILSEGVGASSGVLIIDADKSYYVAKTSPDLKSAITSLVAILDQAIVVLTTLDAGMVVPGGAAAGIATLTTLKTTFNTTKDNLK